MSLTAAALRGRISRAFAFGVALGLLLAVVPRVPALAAPTTYYLAGDGVPVASLTTAAPTATTLPNYDPGRDALPGLVLQPTLLSGIFETDPAKYQRWSAPKGGVDIDGPVSLTIWSASDGFATDRRGTIRVGLFDCNDPGTNCSLIAYDVHSADPWSPSGDWTQHTVGWSNVTYSIPNGHHLEVKVVAGITSETPLLFAYDTIDHPARLTVSGGPSNDPPLAVDDAATVDEDGSIVVDLLANDSDPNGDPLSVSAVGQASNGTVTDNGDGTATYTPDPDWNGVDTFTYDVTDGADTATATVTVTVDPVNDVPNAVNDAALTDEDTAVTIDLLANDSDVDGDALVVAGVTQPADGAVTDNRDGTVTYAPPPDWSGTATFAYDVTDGAAVAVGSVTVDVGAANDAPVAVDDAAAVPEDGTVVIDLLANDFDIDGDSLTVAGVASPDSGAVTNNGDGTATYVPPADWNGTATFTYDVTDGIATTTANVTVTVAPVNDAPTAGDISLTMSEDTTVSFDPRSEAGDVDGDVLAVTATSQPDDASVTLGSDGTVSVTPDADWNGTTTFTYTVSDGIESATATVTVTVSPVNDAPTATDDTASTEEDMAVLVDVLANDGDIDGDTVAITSVTSVGAGSAVVEGNAIRYTPPADWHGADTFTYTVGDDELSAAASVMVTVTAVNDAPVAADDVASVAEDGRVTVAVLANDTDPDGDPLTIIGVGAAAHGSVSVVGDTVRYAPAPDYHGADGFTYTVADPDGETSTAAVAVAVSAVNDAPVAGADEATTDEDAAVRIDVLANDADVDGDALTVELAAPPSVGAVAVAVDGSLVYTPEADWHGTVQFSYTLSDGELRDTTSVVVTVRSINDDPVAAGDVVSLLEDGRATFEPLANDRDVDGDELAISAWSVPHHGRVSIDAAVVTYVPDPDYNGPDTFSYTVSDGNGGFAAASVVVEVVPVDDVPTVRDDEASTPSGQPITVRVLSNDVDLDGDELTILTITQGDHGTVTDNGDGTLTYTPGEGFLGSDSFLYVVTDGTTPQSAQVTVTRKIDGAALVETSLTPATPSLAYWVPAPSPTEVVSDEVAETIATLAVPAAVTAAAAGATVFAQSEMAARVAIRIARLVVGRF